MGLTQSQPQPQSSGSRAEAVISDQVRQHQVVIFSKRSCSYCDAVKSVMARETQRLNRDDRCAVQEVSVVELDDRPDGRDLQAALLRRTGVTTVPQVFVGSQFVGGAVDTARLANNGGLRIALMHAAKCPISDKEKNKDVDDD